MINNNLFELSTNYVFSAVSQKVAEFKRKNPDVKLTSYGIGDVVFPLSKTVVSALEVAAEKMGTEQGFSGYTDEGGTPELRAAVSKFYKTRRNVQVFENEIFVSDGAKSDIGGLLDLFSTSSVVLVSDPVYPAYVDAATIRGLAVCKVLATPENNFLPPPPSHMSADVIYLCSPANPTGAVYDRGGLEQWVEYAKKAGAVILFDAAYAEFSPLGYPKSIYEIDGAKEVAIEISSFSKSHGFTGLRCGWTVVPSEVKASGTRLQKFWKRRQAARFNGASVLAQAAGVAALSDEGLAEASTAISFYRRNAATLREKLIGEGLEVYGNAPYLWVKCPSGFSDESYFSYCLENKHEIVTPGSGFGSSGRDFVRYGCFFK